MRAHGESSSAPACPPGRDRGRRPLAVLAALAVSATVLAGCSSGADPAPSPTPSASPGASEPPAPLTFGVHGPPDELAAWERVVDAWNGDDPTAPVELLTGRTAGALQEEIEAGDVPDVFLATREQLPALLEADLVQPLAEPLDERGVDFGDGYSRDALQAFSAEDDLQCMPFGISPTVMFLNTDLVDFERMAARGLPVPTSEIQWGFTEYAAAARFATRPRRGVRGAHVDATVEGIAPWVLSGGGQLYDDPADPTTLTLSSEESTAALETLLQLLRSPQVTPMPQQLARVGPVELFERGRLAMLPGDRSLVPRLRQVSGLEFDVRQMPRLGGGATTGTVTGLCLSAEADTAAAADFLLHLLEPDSVAAIASQGYLVPAELEVAQSPAFLQPGRQPAHPEAFLDAVRDIALLPETDDDLAQVVAPALTSMFYDPVIELDELTEAADELSRTVLDPDAVEEGGEGEDGPAEQPFVPTPTESPGQ